MSPDAPPEEADTKAARWRQRRRKGCGAGIAAVLVLVAVLFWLRVVEFEPRYDGRTLSHWLRNTDPGFQWIPNDFYGHIHDELWSQLTQSSPVPSGASPGQSNAASGPVGPKLELGVEAVPWLVSWMRARPSGMEHLVASLLPHLPSTWYPWLSRYDDSPWTGRSGRWHVAAQEGFSRLGIRASNAVPQLAPLLLNEDEALPVALSLASLGPSGVSVLIRALEGTNAPLRETAALALGMSVTREAIPALVHCVELGQSSYQVLGAIGRIEPRQPGVIPPLIRRLRAWETAARGTQRAPFTMEGWMAVLLLGLQGPAASNAVPVLIRLHGATPETVNPIDSERRLLRRVIRVISPESERQLPPPQPRDESDDWP